MKIDDLQIGYWYEFTNYTGTICYCKYLGIGSRDHAAYLYGGQYVFHFLDGCEYDYSVRDISTCIKACPKVFSDYLNLFIPEDPNEITIWKGRNSGII